MDPITLGMAAAGLVAPYLAQASNVAATRIGEAAAGQIENMLSVIRQKFTSESDAASSQTLDRLEHEPTLESHKRDLAGVLAEKAAADPGFSAELERLIRAAQASSAAPRFTTEVSGGQVGQIINAGSVGTMNFGQVPPANADAERR